MPGAPAEWMRMFNRVYEKGQSTSHENIFGRLTEELGELAEAVRALPVSRGYFISEAADVFAWLMGEANQHHYDLEKQALATDDDRGTFLEAALWAEYPGHCSYCVSRVCKCAPFPKDTLGRIAQEGPPSMAAYGASGGLFTTQEMLEYFRVADEAIVIAGTQYRVTPELFSDVQETSRRILDSLEKLTELQGHTGADVIAAIARLEVLASRQELTQRDIDILREALAKMPSEARSMLLGLITNLGASGWFYALLNAVGG